MRNSSVSLLVNQSQLLFGKHYVLNERLAIKLLHYRKKNGIVIKESIRIRTVRLNNSYQLIIEDIEADDAGDYEVTLENGFGSISSSAQLFVEGL